MSTHFELLNAPYHSYWTSGTITRLDLDAEAFKDVICFDTFNCMQDTNANHINYLPKARLFSLGRRFYKYGPRNSFDPIYFMKTHALCSSVFRPDRENVPIPFCKPVIQPSTKILRVFQINNFIFVVKMLDGIPLQEILVTPPEDRIKFMKHLRMEIYEVLARITPDRVHYSIHSHGYINLVIVPRMARTVQKLQCFFRRGMFKRRCLRRSALFAVCMANHKRLGGGASHGLVRLMEDPNDCIMRSIIAQLVLPPRKK